MAASCCPAARPSLLGAGGLAACRDRWIAALVGRRRSSSWRSHVGAGLPSRRGPVPDRPAGCCAPTRSRRTCSRDRRGRPHRHLGRARRGAGRADPRRVVRRAGLRSSSAACRLAVLADNLGVLWVAVEATTITTAFLVGHHRGPARARGGLEVRRPRLRRRRDRLPRHRAALRGRPQRRRRRPCRGPPWPRPAAAGPGLVRVAVALTVLGFATKAGLAPDAQLAARRAQPGARPRSPA